jgi:hypothetical protein
LPKYREGPGKSSFSEMSLSTGRGPGKKKIRDLSKYRKKPRKVKISLKSASVTGRSPRKFPPVQAEIRKIASFQKFAKVQGEVQENQHFLKIA